MILVLPAMFPDPHGNVPGPLAVLVNLNCSVDTGVAEPWAEASSLDGPEVFRLLVCRIWCGGEGTVLLCSHLSLRWGIRCSRLLMWVLTWCGVWSLLCVLMMNRVSLFVVNLVYDVVIRYRVCGCRLMRFILSLLWRVVVFLRTVVTLLVLWCG